MRSPIRPRLPHVLTASLLLAGLSAVPAEPVRAAGNADAKIMLHALSPTTKNICTRAANIPNACSSYDAGVNNLALYPTLYYTYLLVVNGSQAEGVAGMQCGISYPGGFAPTGGNTPINVYGWTLCATLEFTSGGWPNPGSGTLITWNAVGPQCTAPPGNATIGAVGVAGFFYMAGYGPGQMRVTRRPVDNAAKVANCGSVEDIVSDDGGDGGTFLGAIGFGTTGINPCGRGVLDTGCSITGPDEVMAGQNGILYSVDGDGPYSWSISGNGTIDGPTNQQTVLVDAGAPGSFTLQAFGGQVFGCSKLVTVHSPVPVEPTSWGRIKTLTMGQ